MVPASASGCKALAVISPHAGDGKTYCAANLAVALAQLGGRTLLVDADMRGPRIHELFKLNSQAGLSSILSGRADKQVIAARCGSALVVARKDKSRSHALRELVASLQGAPVKLAGVVFNEY